MNLPRSFRYALISLSLAATTAACAPPLPEGAVAKAVGATSAVADAKTPVAVPGDSAAVAAVRAQLAKAMPDVTLDAIHPSAVPGLYEIQRGSLYGYVTADGKFLISGDLVNLQSGEEITEGSRKTARLDDLAKLGDQYIEFDPPNGKPDHVVTVFTDTDCGYCRKLHSEIGTYTALGIGIRYVFYPRQGPGSPSFQQAEAVWCSADRKAAFTKAKLGEKITAAACKNPVQRDWELGQKFGLRGTPMLILPNGEVVNGYVPADRLAQRLVESSLPASARGQP